MIEHPDTGRLKLALSRQPPTPPWHGVNRSASPRYATGADLLSGVGRKLAGARRNESKRFPAAYTSLDPHTALDEVLAHFRDYGLPIESAMPRVTVSVRVALERILDLTDRSTLSSLRLSRKGLLYEPWRIMQDSGEEAITQALGRVARDSGFEGLLVPSAARKAGTNLIILPDNRLSPSHLTIIILTNSQFLPQFNQANLHATILGSCSLLRQNGLRRTTQWQRVRRKSRTTRLRFTPMP